MPLRAYLSVIASDRRLIAFGCLMTFSSSFGQTYFIGIFGPAIQGEFGLSHTAWGAVYMAGTLASAAVLPWTGRLIDRVNLRTYMAWVCAGGAIACVLVASTTGPVLLGLAIFALRQTGQGLMSHVGITTMARYFDAGRGRAIALASAGFAAGEAVLPYLAVLAIAALGWRSSYLGVALLLGVVVLTAAWRLLGGRHDPSHVLELTGREGAGGSGTSRPSWTRAQVLRDRRFYLLLPGILAPSAALTAMFFHHLNLADAKGWSYAWITGNYVLYALGSIATVLVAGPLIDRFGSAWIVRPMLVPMIVGLAVVASFDAPWAAPPYLVLIGVATGLSHTGVAALWAELYGVAHLGAIKSLAAALSVFGSALGPVAMGALMDVGLSIERVCLLFAGVSAVGGVLIVVALAGPRGHPAVPPAPAP